MDYLLEFQEELDNKKEINKAIISLMNFINFNIVVWMVNLYIKDIADYATWIINTIKHQ